MGKGYKKRVHRKKTHPRTYKCLLDIVKILPTVTRKTSGH